MEKATPRQMFKQIQAAEMVYNDPPSVAHTVTNGWEIVGDGIVFRTYIDLSGYTQQDLTTFVQGIDIQKNFIPYLSGSAQTLKEVDIISTRRITDAELTNIPLGETPGFQPSTVDLQEVIYGERMQYGINPPIQNTFVQISSDTFGSGNPSAADRLHWTRYLIMENGVSATDTLTVYPTNLVVQAITGEEKDLVYIERLRRSYTQQRTEP
jgi:hypothetical protein